MTKLLLLSYLLCTQFVHSVVLQRVILSTNGNPYYSQFWPIVAPLWQALGIKPTLIFVANKDCQIDETLGDVIRFEPLTDLPESLQAQSLRLLLPVLFPDDICILSDIDMIPVSFTYFTDGAALCTDENAFMVYRDRAYVDNPRWPMCYVAAKGKIFSQIFGASCIEEFPAILREWRSFDYGWNTDELVMYQYAKRWEERGGTVWYKGDETFGRIDRIDWNNLPEDELAIEGWIDCHMPRPYSDYASSIDKVVQAICKNWEKKKQKAS